MGSSRRRPLTPQEENEAEERYYQRYLNDMVRGTPTLDPSLDDIFGDSEDPEQQAKERAYQRAEADAPKIRASGQSRIVTPEPETPTPKRDMDQGGPDFGRRR